MHHGQRVKSSPYVIDHDANPFGQSLEQPNRRRLQNVEDTKKYKSSQKGFPSQRDGDEGNELTRHFVDDDELRIFNARSARDSRGRGDADKRDARCREYGGPGTRVGWK